MSLSQKWIDTVEKGIDDVRWDQYDGSIQKEVEAYSSRLNKTPNFLSPSWLYIKAMLWTESGGPDNPAWTTRPFQIGNKGDPAYDVLKNEKEGSSLIMSATLKGDIKADKINTPDVNLRAGIAYLYTRMATYDHKSIRDTKDTAKHTYAVQANDNFERIAKKIGTTVTELRQSNPSVDPTKLQIGQKLDYYKAEIRLVITGWRKFTTEKMAERYNGGGDVNYKAKLDYLIGTVFPKLKRNKTK
ncbi:LysM domain-containing protein [uncultured Roseibium sp.]|uniref:LysM peptidoglycan-binding domain-containing protein n=1 Tax=uncultured Roseibium sp. TaxID=1936171 RepID=UPI0026250055|nr:LysM domain-containing protein [uncultured Roseibium sp.]